MPVPPISIGVSGSEPVRKLLPWWRRRPCLRGQAGTEACPHHGLVLEGWSIAPARRFPHKLSVVQDEHGHQVGGSAAVDGADAEDQSLWAVLLPPVDTREILSALVVLKEVARLVVRILNLRA